MHLYLFHKQQIVLKFKKNICDWRRVFLVVIFIFEVFGIADQCGRKNTFKFIKYPLTKPKAVKYLILIVQVLLIQASTLLAQQKNFIKVNVGDCINCVSALSYILKQDPQVNFVFHGEFLSDSNDVIEKFALEPYRRQIFFSTPLYDSLSRETESELIQFCDNKVINRSGLRNLKFIKGNGCSIDTFCLKDLSNHIIFKDYKDFVLITNYISYKQFIYYKKDKTLKSISIEPEIIKSIYVDFLKKPDLYEYYKFESTQTPSIAPKIKSIFPYDDTTVIAALLTYNAEITTAQDTILSQMTSFIKINKHQNNEVLFLSDRLPKKEQYFYTQVLSHKSQLYVPLHLDMSNRTDSSLGTENLVRLKKEKHYFKFDKYLPSILNEYLISSKVYQNCNTYFLDNGYFFMSLSNYIINVETDEKIYLPFEDSVFRKIYLYPQLKGINYSVWDFKYNVLESKFYILYHQDSNSIYASFKAGSKKFETHELLYTLDQSFSYAFKNKCLSWDGKKIVYSMKGEDCFKSSSVEEFQELAREFERVKKLKDAQKAKEAREAKELK